MRPVAIVERSFPKNINQNELPIIVINQCTFECSFLTLCGPTCRCCTLVGLKAIVSYYEKELDIDDLINKSTGFMKLNPRYQISDKSTHKNLKFDVCIKI